VTTIGFISVTGSSFTNNQAIAGNSQRGGGGLGTGGALSVEGGGIPNAPTLTISQTMFQANLVMGGSDSNGGFTLAGMGGGIFMGTVALSGGLISDNLSSPPLPGAVLSLTNTIIIGDLAQAGEAANGGTVGQGIGGGLYLATGSTTTLKSTIVAGNFTSTSNDDISGTYTSS
jgi:hypothetical protein